jgi:hypothetical protein
MEGALMCEACGMPLHARHSTATKALEGESLSETLSVPMVPAAGDDEAAEVAREREVPGVPRGAEEFLVSARVVIPLEGGDVSEHIIAVEDRIVIGRVDHRTDFLPDLNLSRYAAWEKGVSRLHAAIHRDGAQLYLVDLASTNGTYLNGECLSPRVPHLLADGDSIRLGLFELKIYYQYSALDDNE